MWEFLLRPFRGENYLRARRIGDKTVTVLGSYVRGTATVAFVDAVGILIGLLILQVPLAIPLAVLVFLLAFIPIVGATVAGILAALVALVANGPVNALFVVGVVVLVNQLEGNFLQPVLMGRSMKLHAFVILVALTVGTVLGGIVGAVLAVPITAAVWGAIQVWDGPGLPARWARPKDPIESPDGRPRAERSDARPCRMRRAGWTHAVRDPRADARQVRPRGARSGQGAGRPELRAEMGRLPRARLVGRRERRDRQPRREAAHPLLPRTRRGVLTAAARALPARRRGRRPQGRAGRAASGLGLAHAAHPPRGIPGEHARRDDAGDVHRVRPARPRRPRPAVRAVRGAARRARRPARRAAASGACHQDDDGCRDRARAG